MSFYITEIAPFFFFLQSLFHRSAAVNHRRHDYEITNDRVQKDEKQCPVINNQCTFFNLDDF